MPWCISTVRPAQESLPQCLVILGIGHAFFLRDKWKRVIIGQGFADSPQQLEALVKVKMESGRR
jgi:hypothetical protein